MAGAAQIQNRRAIERVLRWADAHFGRTGRWPTTRSGPVPGEPHLTWHSVDEALRHGHMGLPGGSTLARLLVQERNKRFNSSAVLPHVAEIVRWADHHRKVTGAFPNRNSGRILDAPHRTWNSIDKAIKRGAIVIDGVGSLADLLMSARGVPNPKNLPPLTKQQILVWADSHYDRTGQWPMQTSGQVRGQPYETWQNIDNALRFGRRGLPGGSSLAQFLAHRRGKIKDHPGFPGNAALILRKKYSSSRKP